MYYLTIDSGTTNTRAALWNDDKQVLARCKYNIGARTTVIDGCNNKLKEVVKSCIDRALKDSGVSLDYCTIIATGMISSGAGLYEIPHLTAPAGKAEFAAAMQKAVIDGVCSAPIWFIPGMKNSVNGVRGDNSSEIDMMRGEEVESIAILAALENEHPYTLVLPGSHTKFVAVNGSGMLTGCLSTLSGELLEAVTTGTILADAVGKQYVTPKSYNREMLFKGCDDVNRLGISRALFQARIMRMFSSVSREDAACYLMGAILSGDVKAAESSAILGLSKDTSLVVAGKEPFLTVYVDLFRYAGYNNTETFPFIPELSGAGALEVWLERQRLLKL